MAPLKLDGGGFKKKGKKAASSNDNGPMVMAAAAVILVAVVTLALLPDTLPDPRDGNGANGDSSARQKGTPQLLLKWLKKNGALINESVKIDHGPNGRGLFMRKPAHSSDQMYEVPETVWFSPATLRAKSKFRAVLDDPGFQALMTSSGSSHHKELAFAMLYERNLPTSHWRPYIQTLPVLDPDNAGPVWTRWGEEELAELQSEHSAAQLRIEHKLFSKNFAAVSDFLGKAHPKIWRASNATLQEYLHTYFQIISRSYNCQLPTAEGHSVVESQFHHSRAVQTCLIPFCDLANHEHTAVNQNTMVMTMPAKLAFYSVRAPVEYAKGDEIMQSYAGDPDRIESTFHYLTSYGMVNPDLDNTKGDYILLALSHPSLGGKPAFSPIEASARLRQSAVDQAIGLLQHNNPDAGMADAIAVIQAAVETNIAKFATNVNDDRSELESVATPYWHRTALLFRMRHKRILLKLQADLAGAGAGTPTFATDGDFPTAAWQPGNGGVLERNAMYRVDVQF